MVPLGEDQIAADHDAAPLVAFGKEGEEHLHLLAALLDVAEVVQDHDLEAVQALEQRRESQPAFDPMPGTSASIGFKKPKQGRIAVKVINHLGDEVMKVFQV